MFTITLPLWAIVLISLLSVLGLAAVLILAVVFGFCVLAVIAGRNPRQVVDTPARATPTTPPTPQP
jgi:hypothetical protein